jgi:hypothetical protein
MYRPVLPRVPASCCCCSRLRLYYELPRLVPVTGHGQRYSYTDVRSAARATGCTHQHNSKMDKALVSVNVGVSVRMCIAEIQKLRGEKPPVNSAQQQPKGWSSIDRLAAPLVRTQTLRPRVYKPRTPDERLIQRGYRTQRRVFLRKHIAAPPTPPAPSLREALSSLDQDTTASLKTKDPRQAFRAMRALTARKHAGIPTRFRVDRPWLSERQLRHRLKEDMLERMALSQNAFRHTLQTSAAPWMQKNKQVDILSGSWKVQTPRDTRLLKRVKLPRMEARSKRSSSEGFGAGDKVKLKVSVGALTHGCLRNCEMTADAIGEVLMGGRRWRGDYLVQWPTSSGGQRLWVKHQELQMVNKNTMPRPNTVEETKGEPIVAV